MAVATLIAAGVSAAGGTGITLLRGRQARRQQEEAIAQAEAERRAQAQHLQAQIRSSHEMQMTHARQAAEARAHQQRLVMYGAAGLILVVGIGAAVFVARS